MAGGGDDHSDAGEEAEGRSGGEVQIQHTADTPPTTGDSGLSATIAKRNITTIS